MPSTRWSRLEHLLKALDADLEEGFEVELNGRGGKLELEHLEDFGMDSPKRAHARVALGEEDLGATAAQVGRVVARAHPVLGGGEREHLERALDETVYDLKAGGVRVRIDGRETATVGCANVRARVEMHSVTHLEQPPRQRILLVRAKRLEEAGEQRRATHLELDRLWVGDHDRLHACVHPPHILEGLVVRAECEGECLGEACLGHLEAHEIGEA
jgi:hypothetical protein